MNRPALGTVFPRTLGSQVTHRAARFIIRAAMRFRVICKLKYYNCGSEWPRSRHTLPLAKLAGGDPRFARVKRKQKAFGSEVVNSLSLRMTKTVVPYRMYGSTIQTSSLGKSLPPSRSVVSKETGRSKRKNES
jgi:hypothetical protein